MDPVTQTCGCGGVVPREDGPTHPYLAAAPGCWRLYGELTLRLAGPGTAQPSHVDCYAAQHPGGAEVDRRQRASVAVHLVALCARLERGVPAERLNRVRSRVTATVLAARGLPDWPLLAAPEAFGPVTAAGLHGFSHESSRGLAGDGFSAALAAWPRSVWSAWSEHHESVRGWTQAVLDGDP